jgi:hypothetical protein
MGVILKHGSSVHGEPGQNTNVFEIGFTLEPQESESLVNTVAILSPLGFGVGEIRIEAAAEVGICNVHRTEVKVALDKLAVSFRFELGI